MSDLLRAILDYSKKGAEMSKNVYDQVAAAAFGTDTKEAP